MSGGRCRWMRGRRPSLSEDPRGAMPRAGVIYVCAARQRPHVPGRPVAPHAGICVSTATTTGLRSTRAGHHYGTHRPRLPPVVLRPAPAAAASASRADARRAASQKVYNNYYVQNSDQRTHSYITRTYTRYSPFCLSPSANYIYVLTTRDDAARHNSCRPVHDRTLESKLV